LGAPHKVRTLFIILMTVVFGYGVLNFYQTITTATDENFFEDSKEGVTVKAVTRGGASERAGIKVGDVIIRINGQTFKNAMEADRNLRSIGSGKTVEYVVRRDGQELRLEMTLASIGINIYLLSFFLTGFISLGTAAFFGLLRPQLKEARLLFVTFLFWSVFLFSLSLRISYSFVIQIAVNPIWIALFFYSSFYFPTMRNDILQRRWLVYMFLFSASVLSIFLTTVGILLLLKIIKFVFAWIILMINACALFIVVYGITIFVLHRKSRPAADKPLSRYIKWAGWIVGVSFALATGVCVYYNIAWIVYGQYAFFSLLLLPTAYVYTTHRFRLLDYHPIIRRSRVYVAVSTLINLLLIAALILGITYLPKFEINYPVIWFTGEKIEVALVNQLPAEKREHWKVKAVAIETILFIILLWRLRASLQTMMAKKFHQEKYDYKKALAEFSSIVARCLDREHLTGEVVNKLRSLMHLKNIGIVLAENGGLLPADAYGFEHHSWQELRFQSDAPWLKQLASSGRANSIEHITPEEKTLLKKLGASFMAPITLNGRLLGLFVLGEKLSEDHYRVEDLELLEAAATQTAVALENVNLYRELKQQEHLKSELQIAHKIQLGSLPKRVPNIAGLEIFAHSEPASEVGGDFYDFFQFNAQQFMAVVGDVSGKGTSAALYVAKIQGIMRSIYEYHPAPADLFTKLNSVLSGDIEKNFFITQVGAKFDLQTRTATLVRAGHEPALYFDAEKRSVQFIESAGLALCLTSPQDFKQQIEEKIVPLKSGDLFVMFTDGVSDARTPQGSEFGETRLAEFLKQSAHLPAEAIAKGVIASVEQFTRGGKRFDDLTVCVVKVK